MTHINVTIRGMDEQLYRQIKALAAQKGVTVGQVVKDAFSCLIQHRKEEKPDIRNFLKLKPEDWGPGSENSSQEIDEVLYGGPEPA